MAHGGSRTHAPDENPDDDKKEHNIGGFPMRVGKAVKDDPKIKQPKGAEMGIVPRVPFRWIFTGPSNSGKTNLARWVLDKFYQKSPKESFFERIYLFSPTAKLDPVWKDLVGLRNSDRITELENGGKEKLFEIIERGNRRTKALGKDKAPNTLVIIDDGIADVKFMNSRPYTRGFIAGRHGNISIMKMTQSYNKVPRIARMQATALSMFPSKTTEIERLWDEHGPIGMGKWEFVDMVKYAINKTEEEKYPFLFIDTDKPEQERFRRSLHEVLVPRPTSAISQPSYSPMEGHEVAAGVGLHQQKAKRHQSAVVDQTLLSTQPHQKRRRL
jgi:hypothetical protein